jgi:spore germination protein YaaH
MRVRIALAAALLVATTANAAYRISVWLPPWLSSAQSRTTQHAGIMTESNPVYYTVNLDGTIKVNWNAETAAWTTAMSGTEVIPTFQNYTSNGWDAAVVVNYIIHPSHRDAYTTNITNLVVSKGYAGADIDYENLPLSARADFNAFIEMLAQKLHAQGKKLSVCVYGKTKDATSYAPAAMQDYAHIGAHADSVKIMTYGSQPSPQPTTTFAYLGNVLTYAKSTIPHHKIKLGLHWYAHDFESGQWSKSITYQKVLDILAANPGIVPVRDSTSGELTFQYTSNGILHTVWYVDGAGNAAKMQYAMQNHGTLGGFAYWSMGEEDPAVWGAMAHLRPSWEFNKDGNHDVVLRNNATGGVALWNIAGNAITQGTQIATDPAYVVEVAGRFTRDGHSDVVLRNPSSGEMKLWQMNNHSIAAVQTLPTMLDSNWKVVGAGDTNSDGRAEIIWYHQTGGHVAVTKLTNGVWQRTTIEYGVPLEWRLQYTGDFNFDGKADLLWRNVNNGDFAMWNLDDLTITNRAPVPFGASVAWQLAGVADFNRDGYFDWVLRNESTGQVAIYEMKDRTLLNGAACTTTLGAEWKIVRAGDFTGDNKADILWRNANNGTVMLWQMDLRTVVATPTLGAPGVDWTITAR